MEKVILLVLTLKSLYIIMVKRIHQKNALAAFVEGGEFADYCDCREIADGTNKPELLYK